MRSLFFVFPVGLVTSFLVLLSLGAPVFIALQMVAVLGTGTLLLAGLAAILTGELRLPQRSGGIA